MKKNLLKVLMLTTIITTATISGCSCNKNNISVESLPSPKAGSGFLGETFGVDANINMSTIDKYLDMSGVVYRDMRMLVAPI